MLLLVKMCVAAYDVIRCVGIVRIVISFNAN